MPKFKRVNNEQTRNLKNAFLSPEPLLEDRVKSRMTTRRKAVAESDSESDFSDSDVSDSDYDDGQLETSKINDDAKFSDPDTETETVPENNLYPSPTLNSDNAEFSESGTETEIESDTETETVSENSIYPSLTLNSDNAEFSESGTETEIESDSDTEYYDTYPEQLQTSNWPAAPEEPEYQGDKQLYPTEDLKKMDTTSLSTPEDQSEKQGEGDLKNILLKHNESKKKGEPTDFTIERTRQILDCGENTIVDCANERNRVLEELRLQVESANAKLEELTQEKDRLSNELQVETAAREALDQNNVSSEAKANCNEQEAKIKKLEEELKHMTENFNSVTSHQEKLFEIIDSKTPVPPERKGSLRHQSPVPVPPKRKGSLRRQSKGGLAFKSHVDSHFHQNPNNLRRVVIEIFASIGAQADRRRKRRPKKKRKASIVRIVKSIF